MTALAVLLEDRQHVLVEGHRTVRGGSRHRYAEQKAKSDSRSHHGSIRSKTKLGAIIPGITLEGNGEFDWRGAITRPHAWAWQTGVRAPRVRCSKVRMSQAAETAA